MSGKMTSGRDAPRRRLDSRLVSAASMFEDPESVLRLLCSGARLENRIHLTCYVFDRDGTPRDLGLATPDPFDTAFCRCARGLEGASGVCRRWHEDVAKACRQAGPVLTDRVVDCPLGLSVLVAPVAYRGTVIALLFTGD